MFIRPFWIVCSYLLQVAESVLWSRVERIQINGPAVILTPADLNRILEESDEHEDKDS